MPPDGASSCIFAARCSLTSSPKMFSIDDDLADVDADA
jgi:hypothetical protein